MNWFIVRRHGRTTALNLDHVAAVEFDAHGADLTLAINPRDDDPWRTSPPRLDPIEADDLRRVLYHRAVAVSGATPPGTETP